MTEKKDVFDLTKILPRTSDHLFNKNSFVTVKKVKKQVLVDQILNFEAAEFQTATFSYTNGTNSKYRNTLQQVCQNCLNTKTSCETGIYSKHECAILHTKDASCDKDINLNYIPCTSDASGPIEPKSCATNSPITDVVQTSTSQLNGYCITQQNCKADKELSPMTENFIECDDNRQILSVYNESDENKTSDISKISEHCSKDKELLNPRKTEENCREDKGRHRVRKLSVFQQEELISESKTGNEETEAFSMKKQEGVDEEDEKITPIKKLSDCQKVREETDPIRKTSGIMNDTGRSGRRDSVVAMSSRRYSLSPATSKTKIRKTSFVAPRVSVKRTSLHNTTKDKLPERRTTRLESNKDISHKETRQIEVTILIKQSGERSTLTLDIDDVVKGLQTLYPSSEIELVNFSNNRQDINVKDQGNRNSVMSPRNEFLMTIPTETISITEAIQDIKQKPNNVAVLIDFCRKMATFATDDSLNVLLAKQEGISHIMKAINNFKENQDLIKSACQTLLKMTSFSDANCVLIYKENGISLLVDLLHVYTDEAELLLIILDILTHLSMSDNDCITDCMLEHSCHTIVLTTMSRHGDNGDIVKRCCFILSHLVTTVETARSLMFIGGVHVIIGSMKRYKDNNEVLESGCRALGSFAVHDDICMDVANAGAVNIVLHALERSQEDEYLIECALWGLACLTKFDDVCKDVCKACQMERMVNAMKKYPSTESVQEYGCWTICNVVAHETTVDVDISHAIIDVLLDATSVFLDNIDLQEQILFTISKIITHNDSILHRFVSRNGISSTIKTMKQYPEHCQIQEQGCRIIGNTAVQDKHRLHVEMEGGSNVIVSAMLTLDNCEDMQEVGCLALTNITANVHKNKITAVKSGCVTAVLRAMKEYGDCDDIVLSGLKTICNVIEIDEACYNFLEEDGINILCSLLSKSKATEEYKEIQLFAGNALSRLSSIIGIDTDYIDKAEEALFRIIKITDDDPETVLCLCHFYENLLQTERGFKMYQEKKVLGCVYQWMDTYYDDLNIQTSCCKILAAIALYDKDICIDMYKIMKKCMMKYKDNSDIQLICCGAIVYIADKSDFCRDSLVQNDAVPLVLSAVQSNITVEKLIDVGLMALNALLCKGDTIPGCDEYKIHCIVEALRLYPDNTEIQIHACNILSKLQFNSQGIHNHNENDTRETFNHIVSVMKRRRSNGELQAAAMEALQCLIKDEPDSMVQSMKEELTYLSRTWTLNNNMIHAK